MQGMKALPPRIALLWPHVCETWCQSSLSSQG